MHTRKLGVAFAVVVGLSLICPAKAAVSWLTPNGSTANYDFTNGNTDNQLFVPAGTNPTVTPTGLLFFPSNFKAQSTNGIASSQAQVSDTLRFEIHVKPGKQLAGFTVDEFGDYSIQGTGANTVVKAFGTLFLTNLDTGDVRFDTLHTTPAALNGSGITSGSSAWTGEENIVPVPDGWTNIQVVLNNILQAGSDPGSSSVIEKKVVTPGIEITIIVPEPGTLSLAFIGGGLLLVRRSRRQLAA